MIIIRCLKKKLERGRFFVGFCGVFLGGSTWLDQGLLCIRELLLVVFVGPCGTGDQTRIWHRKGKHLNPFVFVVAGIEPWASQMQGKCSATELCTQPTHLKGILRLYRSPVIPDLLVFTFIKSFCLKPHLAMLRAYT